MGRYGFDPVFALAIEGEEDDSLQPGDALPPNRSVSMPSVGTLRRMVARPVKAFNKIDTFFAISLDVFQSLRGDLFDAKGADISRTLTARSTSLLLKCAMLNTSAVH